jgi:hypothetical protein
MNLTDPPPWPGSTPETARIELVRARHQIQIRQTVLAWFAEASKRGTWKLTAERLSEFRELVIAMGLAVGKLEALRLQRSNLVPEQFETEWARVVDRIAAEGKATFDSLVKGPNARKLGTLKIGTTLSNPAPKGVTAAALSRLLFRIP